MSLLLLFGSQSAQLTPVGRAESRDTAQVAEAQPVVLKLT
jgi:hypothetical protein